MIFHRLYLFNNVFFHWQYSVTKYIKFIRAIFHPYNRLDGVICSSSLLSDKYVNGLVFKVCPISNNKIANLLKFKNAFPATFFKHRFIFPMSLCKIHPTMVISLR